MDGAGLAGNKEAAAGEADDAEESAARERAVSNLLYGDESAGVHETGRVPAWLDVRSARSTTSSNC